MMGKKLLYLVFILVISGCNNSNKKALTSTEKSNEKIFTKELKTNSGKIFILTEDKSLGASISKVKLETQSFEKGNNTFDLGEIDPVENVFLADLDNNGFEEFYFTTRSAGSGSYSKIYGFASNNDKSVSPVNVPELSSDSRKSGGIFDGYMGHNEFTVQNGELINEFSVYQQADANAKATGGIRKVKYILIAGEAGWILKPLEIIP